jgi:DNA-directed RNA polymerase I, II, and III subunit RPABC1
MASTNHQIKKDSNTITESVITNIVKMLAYRKWIAEGKDTEDQDFIKKTVNDLLKSKKEEKIYNIKLQKNLLEVETYEQFENKSDWKNFNGNNVIVFLSNQKITGKSQILLDFISKYNTYHKIIVVDSITEKARQILSSGKYTEVFTEIEFMMNITEHVCCPEFTVLKTQEIEELLLSYNAKKKELPKQYDIDPISRYLYLKRGQVVRIVRNSETTGQSVAYRIVVHKGSSAK